jgi:hypothetical protein
MVAARPAGGVTRGAENDLDGIPVMMPSGFRRS